MWRVFDEDGCPVAFMMEEVEALTFKEVFYKDGSVAFRTIVVKGLEDE